MMKRSLPLILLAGPGLMLGACTGLHADIQPVAGDQFVLERAGLSAGLVDRTLADAQNFCGEYGRLFVVTNSRIGSDAYRLEFRCISPGNVPAPPQAVAAAPAPQASRRTRQAIAEPARNRRSAETPAEMISGRPLGFAAMLPPMTQVPPVTAWNPATANVAPALPPVAATPLFAPAPGTILAVPPLTGPRLPRPDNAPMIALQRAEAVTVASAGQAPWTPGSAFTAPAAQGLPPVGNSPLFQTMPPVQAQPLGQAQPLFPSAPQSPPMAQPLPPVGNSPFLQGQPVAQPQREVLPPLQPASQLLSVPPPGFGLSVPSPNPLPGASNSLPPIAGGSTRPLALPGTNVPSFPSSQSGFTQGFR